jgi:putative flippase GtrA
MTMASASLSIVEVTKWCLIQMNCRLARYAFGGICATVVQFTTLVVLVEQFHLGEFEAVITAFIVGVAVNYALQRWVTFETASPHLTAVSRFGAIAALSAISNAALFAMLNAYLPYLLAQSIATLSLFLINYELNRRIVFQSHRGLPRGTRA